MDIWVKEDLLHMILDDPVEDAPYLFDAWFYASVGGKMEKFTTV
jgi:hypothetical protein